ncbi:MAG: nucleoside triphosphate pyrophosphohydrolase, partial [Proteobacteria bacterium]|nr:nucleoside triphosphate pyrophosphohydrolase [Pseudomonadota bacterium]
MKIFQEVINTIEYLRSEEGCPWDRAQTMESYKKYILEEVYELFDAIEKNNLKDISEELGDLLLNILLMATILKERGGNKIEEILINLNKKIISRHPHVFDKNKEYSLDSSYKSWVNEKREKENKGLFSDIP